MSHNSSGSSDFSNIVLKYRVHCFVENGKASFISTQLQLPGHKPLSDDDVGWASFVDHVTNDAEWLLGDWFDLKEAIWFECFPGTALDGAEDRFEQITFDVTRPHENYKYVQHLSNPRRSEASLSKVEACTSETWALVRKIKNYDLRRSENVA